MKKSNKIADILQTYAAINGIAGLGLMFYIAAFFNNWVIAISYFVAVVVVSFLIYAFGEVISLLQQIKDNTIGMSETHSDDELPEL